jgi:hypothetical protein
MMIGYPDICGLEVKYDGYGSDDDDGLGIVGGRIE